MVVLRTKGKRRKNISNLSNKFAPSLTNLHIQKILKLYLFQMVAYVILVSMFYIGKVRVEILGHTRTWPMLSKATWIKSRT